MLPTDPTALFTWVSPAPSHAAPGNIEKGWQTDSPGDYRLKRLVWAERYEDIRGAIQREKNLKHWPRAWKVDLIVAENPDWSDLYDKLA